VRLDGIRACASGFVAGRSWQRGALAFAWLCRSVCAWPVTQRPSMGRASHEPGTRAPAPASREHRASAPPPVGDVEAPGIEGRDRPGGGRLIGRAGDPGRSARVGERAYALFRGRKGPPVKSWQRVPSGGGPRAVGPGGRGSVAWEWLVVDRGEGTGAAGGAGEDGAGVADELAGEDVDGGGAADGAGEGGGEPAAAEAWAAVDGAWDAGVIGGSGGGARARSVGEEAVEGGEEGGGDVGGEGDADAGVGGRVVDGVPEAVADGEQGVEFFG
jgi:hypothetical protein